MNYPGGEGRNSIPGKGTHQSFSGTWYGEWAGSGERMTLWSSVRRNKQ